jgi:threonyl-tRNA synthetase
MHEFRKIMRALLLHANKFQTRIVEESNRPLGISPEIKKSPAEQMSECLVCFFTVETGDGDQQIDAFFHEILKTTHEVATKNVMISPFVHLSNKIASPQIAKELYEKLLERFKGMDYSINSSHFGFHKSLLLDIKGYPGSFRYREF